MHVYGQLGTIACNKLPKCKVAIFEGLEERHAMHFNPTLKFLQSLIYIHGQSYELWLFTVGNRITNLGPYQNLIKRVRVSADTCRLSMGILSDDLKCLSSKISPFIYTWMPFNIKTKSLFDSIACESFILGYALFPRKCLTQQIWLQTPCTVIHYLEFNKNQITLICN